VSSFFNAAEKKAKKSGVKKTSIKLVKGDPADRIVDAAENDGVDMIVLGSRGLGTFRRVILGSVSTKVCTHAPCTCVIVR
jgi:nucleotide-binding universal stress UspA family protein